MPSPVAHTLAGIVAYEVLCRKRGIDSARKSWKLLLPWIILPNLPDIDYFLSYLFFNDPRVLHGGFTHTLVFALLVSLFLVPWKVFGSALATFTIALTLIGSHLLLDMATGKAIGLSSGVGVMLFFPFSEERLSFPLTLFIGPRHRTFSEWFRIENAISMTWELLIFTPILLFLRNSDPRRPRMT